MSRAARGIRELIRPEPVLEGAGVRLRRSIGTRTLDNVDPFLLFDDFSSPNPADHTAGFPMHPHRGIETVTYLLDGTVKHRDTTGAHGVLGPGDVQWMTAGSGILHEEMPQQRARGIAGFQLWVNLPAKLKMTPPRYQEFAAADIPEVGVEAGVKVRIIAGSIGKVEGPVKGIAAAPIYLDVRLHAGTKFEHALPSSYAAFIYVYDGEALVGDRSVGHPKMAVLGSGDVVSVGASAEGARFLLVAGKPLGEPVARHGPFVMNTRAEIEQALKDLQQGTFIKKENV